MDFAIRGAFIAIAIVLVVGFLLAAARKPIKTQGDGSFLVGYNSGFKIFVASSSPN